MKSKKGKKNMFKKIKNICENEKPDKILRVALLGIYMISIGICKLFEATIFNDIFIKIGLGILVISIIMTGNLLMKKILWKK